MGFPHVGASGILDPSPTKEVATMTEIASSWLRPARPVGC